MLYVQECMERNEEILKGNYAVVDAANAFVGECVLVGENAKEAAFYLETCIASSLSVTEIKESVRETEEIYNVSTWDSVDFNLNVILKRSVRK